MACGEVCALRGGWARVSRDDGSEDEWQNPAPALAGHEGTAPLLTVDGDLALRPSADPQAQQLDAEEHDGQGADAEEECQ